MYKLSNLAAKDFEGIFEYTKCLHDVLGMIGSNPLVGMECTEIAVGVRRHNRSKHVIFTDIELIIFL